MVDLQPLCTEGQGFKEYPDRKPYNLKQMNIPMGLGVKFNISNTVKIRTEFLYRKLFTDYLDDVSDKYAPKALLEQNFGPRSVSLAYRGNLIPGGNALYPDEGTPRGNPANKDVYYFFGAHLKFRFNLIIGAIDDRKVDFDGVRYDCPKW